MNYQKQIKRKEIAKRIIISWVVVGVIWFLIGLLVYWLILHIPFDKSVDETTEQKEFTVYGAYDDRIFTKEISLDWETGDLNFKAYDVKMLLTEQEFLFYLCKGYDLDYTLMMAVVQVESDFDKELVSSTNDYGYMQINKMNHAELTKVLGVTDYLDPEQNMRAGCYIFRKLFEKYQQPNLVLMAYNMGETGAKRLWREGIYETEYTKKVFSAQKKLQKGEKQ